MANEKRLIDANIMPHGQFWEGLTDKEKAKVLAYLVMSPTVDAVEVVHAEWDVIEDDYNFDTIYKCSACKEEFVTIDGTPAENLWNYCPNCGAKMDGGNEDA